MSDNNSKKEHQKLSKAEIIERYIKYTYEIGIIPGIKEIEQCSYLCSAKTINNRCGSIEALREQCGIFHRNEKSGKPLKAEIEKRLLRYRIERARRLNQLDIINLKDLPSYDYIKKIYNNKPWAEIWEIIEKNIPNSMYYWKSNVR